MNGSADQRADQCIVEGRQEVKQQTFGDLRLSSDHGGDAGDDPRADLVQQDSIMDTGMHKRNEEEAKQLDAR